MDNREKNIDILQKVIAEAKSKGADASDIIYNQNSTFSLKANKQKLEEYNVSSTQIMGIRIIKDNKIGISYSEEIKKDSLTKMVEQAIDNSKHVKDSTFEKIYKNSSSKEKFPDNRRTFKEDNTPVEEKIKLCLALEKGITDKDHTVKGAPYNGYSEGESHTYIANSLGAVCFEKRKTFSCYTSALLEQDSYNSMHYHGSVGRSFKELDANKCIDESFNHAQALLHAKPVPTSQYDVIFSSDMLSEIFGVFSIMFSGKSSMDGVNPLRDKIGQKIGTSLLSIQDCPTYKNGFNISTFDDEGNFRKDISLIKNGILRSFYHNSATAKFHKVANNASAGRSPKGTLGVQGTQKIISSGKSEEKELKQGTYLYIISLQGTHSGADPLSGDFSFGASGYMCEDGLTLKAVRGITVSGNFYKSLQEISLIGKDTKSNSYKTFFSPDIRFSKLNIAGK